MQEGGLVEQDPTNSAERPVHERDPVVEPGEGMGCADHGNLVRGSWHGQVEQLCVLVSLMYFSYTALSKVRHLSTGI